MTDRVRQGTSRDRLVSTAARLFRQRGYHGAGVAEILAETGLPKGSLYHHFPQGKADLARAAADLESARILRHIDDAFGAAEDYASGIVRLCDGLADRFDRSGHSEGCPVTAILLYGPDEPDYRHHARDHFISWGNAFTSHAMRFGLDRAAAEDAGCRLQYAIQGAWAMALAEASSQPLRDIPARLGATGLAPASRPA